MKNLSLLIVIIFLLGCLNENNGENKTENEEVFKTPIEIENESLNSGITNDSLFLDCFFGMSNSDWKNTMQKFVTNNGVQINSDSSVLSYSNTENFNFYLTTQFLFYNDKLYRTKSFVNPKLAEKKNEMENTLEDELIKKIKINNILGESLMRGTQNSKYYWVKGNKRIDFFDTLNMYVIVYSDIKMERIIAEEIRNEAEQSTLKEKQEYEKVYAKIKENAEHVWPDDYTMQEYTINEQIEAYHYMKLIPDDNIKNKVKRDWPDDFTMQKYTLNKQIEARERLKNNP